MAGATEDRQTPRPVRDGTEPERCEYWAMVDRLVANAEPLPAAQWARIAALFRAGRKDVAA